MIRADWFKTGSGINARVVSLDFFAVDTFWTVSSADVMMSIVRMSRKLCRLRIDNYTSGWAERGLSANTEFIELLCTVFKHNFELK